MSVDLDKYIEEQLGNIDIGFLVKQRISDQVSTEIKLQISKIVKTEIEIMIKTEIKKVLAGKVETDDGWGRKKQYDSFEDLFKEYLQEKMKDSYNIKGVIEKSVKSHVEELYRNHKKEIAQSIASSISSLLEKN